MGQTRIITHIISCILKVSQIQNVFLVSQILPKNELGQNFFVRFLGELKNWGVFKYNKVASFFFIWPIIETRAQILQKNSVAFWAMEFQEKLLLRFTDLYPQLFHLRLKSWGEWFDTFFWGNVQRGKLSEIKPPLKPYLFLELHIVPICIRPALKIHPNWHRRGNKLENLFPSGLNKFTVKSRVLTHLV